MRSFRRASILIGVAVLGAGLLTVTTASGAVAADTCGGSYTWTGNDENGVWNDSGNWKVVGAADGTFPGTTSTVLIPSAAHPPTLDSSSPTELCSLTLGTGGKLTVTGAVNVDSSTRLDAGAQMGVGNTFNAFGGLILASGSVITSANGTLGALVADVGVTLAGNATLSQVDLAVELNRPIRTAGHTLTLSGGAALLLGAGDHITSAPAGGAVIVKNTGGVALAGNASIGAGASLKLGAESVLATVRAFLGEGISTATLSGAGALSWGGGGSILGNITLAGALRTTVTGSGAHALFELGNGKTTLTNKSAHFVLAGGSLDEQDANTAFRNAGTVTQSGGSLAAHAAAAPAFVNAAGAHWTITARSGRTIAVKGSLTNGGTLAVPAGVKVKVSRTFKQTSSGILRLAIRGTSSAKHAAVTAAKLSLAGKLQLQSAKSYKPKVGAKVNAIVKGSSRRGQFTKISSKTYRKHTKWTATYSIKSVNAQLVRN